MKSRVVVFLSLAGGLALLALALLLLSPLAPAAPDFKMIERDILLVDRKTWQPEPLERFLYVTGVLLLPFCLGAAYFGVRRFQQTPNGRRLLERLASPADWLTAPLLLLLLFSAGYAGFTGFDYDRVTTCSLIPGGTISLAVAVILALGATTAAGSRFRERTSRLLRLLLPSLVGVLFLGILLFNILGPEHIRNVPIFWASFNAVFYSVVQVFFGKELLVDFGNQYGLYPHFLEPLFRVVGLSVYTFTAVMGLLNCLAFGCMYRVLTRETADELLAFLGLTTILFFDYFAGRVAQPDLYLQYHPIRILFPAISLLAVRAFAHAPTPRLGALIFALGAAAFLWNPDTGTIVLSAGLLLLFYDALLRRRPREIPGRLLLGVAAAAGVFVSFSVFMRLRYGTFPDYGRFFLSTKVYYFYGLGMLPMPRFGLWVPVLLIYAASLLLSLVALVEGEDTPRPRLLFFLSVLGLGIFTYYQGRSVLGNLLAASYPAILLFVLLSDDVRRNAAPHGRPADRLLSITLLALLFYSVPALATIAPDWVHAIDAKIRVTKSGETTEVLRDIEFLRHYVRPGQEIPILSYNSGVHHLMTQTTNPLDIPSDSEIIYREDFEKQSEYVYKRRGAFVIDKKTINKTATAMFQRNYLDFHENPAGTLVFFPAH